MSIDLEYYNRFPIILREALIMGKVKFPDSLKCEYTDMTVYRGVHYSANKRTIDKSDFISNIERKMKNPMVVADDKNISSYSCSCFLKIDELRVYGKFPRKNQAIAKGTIKKEFGPIVINDDTSHVDLFLFDDIDPSGEFEVI